MQMLKPVCLQLFDESKLNPSARQCISWKQHNSVRCIASGQHCLFRPCKSCTNGLRSVPALALL